MARMIWRLGLTLAAWVVILVVASAAVELTTGQRFPVFAGNMTLFALAPVLVKVWEIRPPKLAKVLWIIFGATHAVLFILLILGSQ